MGVRNCREIGENLQKIVKRLMANDNLVKLLYYTDADPLSGQTLSESEKKEKIFNKRIRLVPKLLPQELADSTISVEVISGRRLNDNDQFRNIVVVVEIFVPITQWIIKDINLRPFAIMGEVQETLNGLTINGLGKMKGGDFDYNFGTDEMTAYIQTFEITTYD